MKSLSLDNMSVSQLRDKLKNQHKIFKNKYDAYASGVKPNKDKLDFLKRTSNHYLKLMNMLYHVIYYDRLIEPSKCIICRTDPEHRAEVVSCYNKHIRLIQLCRDGKDFDAKRIE